VGLAGANGALPTNTAAAGLLATNGAVGAAGGGGLAGATASGGQLGSLVQQAPTTFGIGFTTPLQWSAVMQFG
jgi:hypothetical protein